MDKSTQRKLFSNYEVKIETDNFLWQTPQQVIVEDKNHCRESGSPMGRRIYMISEHLLPRCLLMTKGKAVTFQWRKHADSTFSNPSKFSASLRRQRGCMYLHLRGTEEDTFPWCFRQNCVTWIQSKKHQTNPPCRTFYKITGHYSSKASMSWNEENDWETATNQRRGDMTTKIKCTILDCMLGQERQC